MKHDRDGDLRLAAVERVWRENRCVRRSSAAVYRRWIVRFIGYCRVCGLITRDELTEVGARRFAEWWHAQHPRYRVEPIVASTRSALRACSFSLRSLGEPVAEWCVTEKDARSQSQLIDAFADHLRDVRGNPPSTVRKKVAQLSAFTAYLHANSGNPSAPTLHEIDAYVVQCSQRHARSTVADICSTLRRYVRFLCSCGLIHHDIASSIQSPIVRANEAPHRTLSWSEVQCMLKAIDRTTPVGCRDYALLLMMSVYGMGAGEVIGLELDSIDWQANTVRVVRPKTGAEFLLPLLTDIAQALSNYLRHGRPTRSTTRRLFVTMRVPHGPLSSAVTIRHVLHAAAQQAGLPTTHLGTHVLRHTHACRQLELGTAPKLIGDILGHRDPESTSAYLRVATQRLRELALPVPT